MRYDILDFAGIAQFDPPEVSHPICAQRQAGLSRDWREYQHPLGSAYFHNATLRILTTDDLRDPTALRRLLAAHATHIARVTCESLAARLPHDVEVVISDGAVRGMYSRDSGASYHFDDATGLRDAPKAEFWAYMATFPAHSRDLPRHTESAFARALQAAKARARRGLLVDFTEQQIDEIIAQYQGFLSLRDQGMDVTALLSSLIGIVMPLKPTGGKQQLLLYKATGHK